MAEEFEAGICGGNWWNSSRSVLVAASPCSLGINDIGSFGWAANDVMDIKASSSSGETNNSISDSSIVFQEVQKPHAQTDSTTGSILIDSSLQMMGFGLSTSPTSDLNNQAFVNRGRVDNNNYYSMLQEDSTQIQKEWSPKNFDASTNGFKPNHDPNLDQVSGSCAAAMSQGFSTGYPMSSASYGYSSSTLLQTLFDGETQPPQQSFCNNRSLNNYSSSTPNFGSNSSPTMSPNCWPRFSPFPRPSLPKQQQPCSFWNGSPTGTNHEARAGLFGSPQLQYLTPTTFEEKLTTKANSNEDVKDSGSAMKKSGSEPVLKRPRIETPSPLPTFKVRKEKLGDRITALQQLVSPFGKTDTASVLHEAIEYIKFLHDQVSVLSTPYMKNGAPIQHQKGSDKLKDPECPKQDLNSRGLCLVPISSTFPVANETTADFWTPTFGGSFR